MGGSSKSRLSLSLQYRLSPDPPLPSKPPPGGDESASTSRVQGRSPQEGSPQVNSEGGDEAAA